MARRRAVVLSVLSTALVALSGLGPVVPASAAGSITSDDYESGVIVAANGERAQQKLTALSASSCVDKYAERQAAAMAKIHKMAHQDLKIVLKNCKLRSVGENVAYGFSSPERVTAAWMKSPGHRANLLRTNWKLIGVGAVQDSRGVWYISQVFGQAK